MTTDDPKRLPISNIPTPDETDDDEGVVDATSVPDASPVTVTLAMRRRWFLDNEATLVRFLGPKMIAANIHNFVKGPGGGKLTLHCNGAGCVLCMARHKATPTFMIPAVFIEDAEVAVILVDQGGGPESLRGQLLPLLRQPNITDLIVEVARRGNRHAAVVIRDLSKGAVEGGDDYGTDVIRDVLARGALRSKSVRAAVEQRDNQSLLADLDWVAPKLRLYHPGLNLKDL